MKVTHILKLFGWTILYLVVNVSVSFLWVAIYAYFIDTGHPASYYESYAETAAPYSSIIAGMPLMFLMCWWISRKWEPVFARNSALTIWIMYTLIDLSIVFTSGMTGRLAVLVSISLITKLLAGLYGAKVGSERPVSTHHA